MNGDLSVDMVIVILLQNLITRFFHVCHEALCGGNIQSNWQIFIAFCQVQNADDNSYMAGVEATLVFLVKHGHIVVLNNEQGFTSDNLRALCDVGNSTKAGNNTGYIGNKGIGFKSVFRV